MKGPQQQIFDREKLHINLARIKSHGQNFEVVIDPDLVVEYKHGKEIDIKDLLKSEHIFTDAHKGLKAPESEFEKVFGTQDALEIAKKILADGEIQLTAEYRERVREEKKRKILSIIQRNGIDPRTKLPHPLQRLENAFEQAKIHIDEFKRAEDQVNDIVKKLTPVLPIRFAKKEIQLTVPGDIAVKMYGRIQRFGEIKKEQWMNDGSWFAVVEIPAGLQNEFFDELNKETHGNIQTKIISEG